MCSLIWFGIPKNCPVQSLYGILLLRDSFPLASVVTVPLCMRLYANTAKLFHSVSKREGTLRLKHFWSLTSVHIKCTIFLHIFLMLRWVQFLIYDTCGTPINFRHNFLESSPVTTVWSSTRSYSHIVSPACTCELVSHVKGSIHYTWFRCPQV